MRLSLAALLLGTSMASAVEGPAVFVYQAEKDTIEDRIEALGTLKANESVELRASVTDTVKALHFDDADRVAAGQLLLELANDEEKALLEEARSTVDEAHRQYLRIRSLQEKKTAAESLLDERRRQWETGLARLAVIESRLADRLIRAPFDGVVGLRNVSIGALVGPDDLITTLDDDSVMKLDFPVPSIYLSVLVPGQTIIATSQALAGRHFEGRVESLDSRIDPVTRTIVVRALLPNADHSLRPGMLMTVDVLTAARLAIVIPETSLIPQGDRQFVYLVDRAEDNLVERREVKIGARRPGEVEIVSGLEVGDWVITDGALKVRPGSHVTIRAVDDGATPVRMLLETVTEGEAGP